MADEGIKVSSLQEALALLKQSGYSGETLEVYSGGEEIGTVEV